ncbi:MAG: phosphatidate cytidylyltransferase [Wenzhouxiangella sp.]
MLKTRFLTAVIMAAVGLILLFALPPPMFALAAGLLLLGIGGREAGRLAGLPHPWQWMVFTAALLAVALMLHGLAAGPDRQTGLIGFFVAVWLVLLLWLWQPGFGRHQPSLKLATLSVILLGAWLSLVLLQAHSPWLVLMVVAIIAAADIGAYFSGKAIGGARLAPRISPGKTRAGALGGLLAATTLAAIVALAVPAAPFRPALAAIVGLVLATVSIGGDLLISLLKRQQGLKDSSSLLPGHGGLLDRFDSLGAALPFFALAWLWWGP